jgi:hypothetical protein
VIEQGLDFRIHPDTTAPIDQSFVALSREKVATNIVWDRWTILGFSGAGALLHGALSVSARNTTSVVDLPRSE